MLQCTNCEKEFKTNVEGIAIDNDDYLVAIEDGLQINFNNSGYYAGFTDCLLSNLPKDEPAYEPPIVWNLCHDCVVLILETFPALGATVPIQMQHYSPGFENNERCCRWGSIRKDHGIGER